MNFEVFNIDLSVPTVALKEVVSAVLHTILFHRAFGEVVPLIVECKTLDLSYSCCDNESIFKMVEEKIDHFCSIMSKSASQPDKRGQLCVVFMDKKQKRNMLGFVKAENVVWEEWVIGLKLMQPRKDSDTSWTKQVEADLVKAIEYIIRTVNQKHDHVPRVANSALFPFPFEITLPDEQQAWGTGIDFFKKMMDASPPLLN